MLEFSAYDPRFLPLLDDTDRSVLHSTRNIVYGLWPDLTLAYMNPAWFIFSFENGGEPGVSEQWHLGRNVLDAMPDLLRPFYEQNFRRALNEDRPWEHCYECSSDKVYRKFHLGVFPLAQGQGLLLVNSPVVETEHPEAESSPLESLYADAQGFIGQCCHCRRFRRADVLNTWDWVPAWLKQTPPKVTHGICKSCISFYYHGARLGKDYPPLISTID
jgi:hypothetical protein